MLTPIQTSYAKYGRVRTYCFTYSEALTRNKTINKIGFSQIMGNLYWLVRGMPSDEIYRNGSFIKNDRSTELVSSPFVPVSHRILTEPFHFYRVLRDTFVRSFEPQFAIQPCLSRRVHYVNNIFAHGHF